MSRIRILALFAILVALATALAACGGGGGGEEDPQKVVERASLKGVRSGEIELSLHARSEGEKGGDLTASLSGPFEAGGEGELPQLQLSAKAEGAAQGKELDFHGGVTLLSDRAYLEYEGTAYEVDPTTFGFLKAGFERAQQQGGSEAGIAGCQEAVEGIRFSQFAENLHDKGSVDVGGASTTKVSGDFNVAGAIDALVKLTEGAACGSPLEAVGPLPLRALEEAKGELSKAIKRSHVELYVGDDDIIRKLAVELTIEPPEAAGEKVEFELEASLLGVNEAQGFTRPANAKPLEALLKKLGINPLQLLEAGGAEGLGGLLEGAGGAASGGGSSSGGAAEPGASPRRREYLRCLGRAETSTDLQKCASKLR